MMFLALLTVTVWVVSPASGFLVPPPANFTLPELHEVFMIQDANTGLFLTPYIESGAVQDGQKAALITEAPFNKFDIVSYSGYLTVNKELNSNMFFYFIRAEHDPENAPVIVWLQGGPGGSSMYALFLENGPFMVDEHLNLGQNPYSWTKNHSVVYIDNPIGTGFSFSDSLSGLSTDISQVADNLHKGVTQFLQLFPELQHLPLFLAGESYAGKYIPALAHTIHTRNPTAELKINLKGIAVGNGLTDAYLQLHHSDFAYQIGIIDEKQYFAVNKLEQFNRGLLKLGVETPNVMASEALVLKFADFKSPYNFLNEHSDTLGATYGATEQFLNLPQVQTAIHARRMRYSVIQTAPYLALKDWAGSVLPWLEEILNSGLYRVLYYNGQLDIIVAYVLSENMYHNMKFNNVEEYKNAERKFWCVGKDLAGYVKTGGTFTEVLVRNSGHAVPLEQPAWALDLINRFTRDDLSNAAASCPQ